MKEFIQAAWTIFIMVFSIGMFVLIQVGSFVVPSMVTDNWWGNLFIFLVYIFIVCIIVYYLYILFTFLSDKIYRWTDK
jgi:hypothetical protein